MYTLTKTFEELTVNELYDIIQLRIQTWIVEQDIAFQDLDGYDKQADHLMMFDDDKLVGYIRMIRPGIRFDEASCGRVSLAPDYRGSNNLERIYGEMLMFGDKHDYKVWRTIAQAHVYEKVWKHRGWEIEKEVIEDGVESYEVILRR